MSIKIIKRNIKRPKVKSNLKKVKILFEDNKENKIIERTVLTILGKRGLNPESFSVSHLYNSQNKDRLIDTIYGRLVGYELQKGENHFDKLKVIPNTKKMDLSKLTCDFNLETDTLTISDGTYTYTYTIDDNSIISENGENLPKQESVLTHEEELKRYEEKEAWHREHVRRLNESMQIASKEWYK